MSSSSDPAVLMATVNGSTLSRLGSVGRHHRQGLEMVERNERTNMIAGVVVMMTGVLLSIIFAWAVSGWVNLATVEEPLPVIQPQDEPRLFELAYATPGAIWYTPADLGIATDRYSKRYTEDSVGTQLADADMR